MTRLLLVEDDTAISEPLARVLRREDYQVEIADTGSLAMRQLNQEPFDLLVLDLGLPDMDGLDICRRLREGGARVPILVLTARADEVDTVVGFDAGVDDYVTKPFRLAVLLARVRALLRRTSVLSSGKVSRVGAQDVWVDPRARLAWQGQRELSLTAKEFDLLHLLLQRAGHVVTREQLMREVWDTTWWSSTKTLDMHVSWVRRKLGDDPSDPRYISTVRGLGFRFERD